MLLNNVEYVSMQKADERHQVTNRLIMITTKEITEGIHNYTFNLFIGQTTQVWLDSRTFCIEPG